MSKGTLRYLDPGTVKENNLSEVSDARRSRHTRFTVPLVTREARKNAD